MAPLHGEMLSQASAQGCRRSTNVISTSNHAVFVRTGLFSVRIYFKALIRGAGLG